MRFQGGIMIKNIYSDQWITATKNDEFGGISISVQAGNQLQEMLRRMQSHLEEHERDKALRESDPSVKLAWDSYQMAVAMARETA